MTSTESFLHRIHSTLHAYSKEHARMFRFVLKSGRNPTAFPTDAFGCTPLHYLVSIQSPEALNICLCEKSYDVNQLDTLNQTALCRALHIVSEGSAQPVMPEMVQSLVMILLLHEADPNLCGPTDPTPLMLAVLREDPILVRLLLAAGADPCRRLPTDGLLLKKGDTALSLAVRLNTLIRPSSTPQSPTSQQQIAILTDLLSSPHITPTVMFHAIQQTKSPFVKQYILNFRHLNAELSSVS